MEFQFWCFLANSFKMEPGLNEKICCYRISLFYLAFAVYEIHESNFYFVTSISTIHCLLIIYQISVSVQLDLLYCDINIWNEKTYSQIIIQPALCFVSEEEITKKYTTVTESHYVRLCRMAGVTPLKCYVRQINSSSVNLSNCQMTRKEIKPLAVCLMVRY